MPDVIINVTPQPTASVEVDVDNVASYYYDLAKQWAISDSLVQSLDYSSKYYANVSKGYKEDVDALLSDSGFIAVKNDLTNIDTVADSIANVNTTAGNITNINTVADISSNVTTVAGISSDVTAVNNNATNINACATNTSNINTVAGSIANVNTVAGDKTNIDTVAGISGNVTTVAGISSDVTSVASISSAVSAVNTNASNINAVSNDLTNINSVASDLTNIDSVVGMSSAITTVNSNSTNINTCATNIGNINTCAANISTIADKVSKSGDTMTGDLSIRNTQPKIFYYDNAFNIFGAVYGGYASSSIKVITLVAGAASSGSSGAYLNLRYDTSTLKDGVTASAGVKQSITNWAYPSSRYDDLVLGASGTQYTAPADGYVYLWGTQSDTHGFLILVNESSDISSWSQPTNTNSFELRVWLPVSKGAIYAVIYSGCSVNGFRFIYANGEA